jgi:protein-tyrosine-phosphatase
MQILLVCTANRCRSVMAETLLRHYADQAHMTLFVASAGVNVKRGERADPITIRLLQRQGLSPNVHHRSRRIQEVMHHAWDLILVMEPAQREWMIERYPKYRRQVMCFHPALKTIPDPYRQSWTMYQHVLSEMQILSQDWIKRIMTPPQI